MARVAIALALVCLVAGAAAQVPMRPPTRPVMPAQAGGDTGTIMIQFDNRGSKVEGQAPKIAAALGKLFSVPPKQVSVTNVIGQSGLLNHQSMATFTAVGPTINGKTIYENCVSNVKNGWFSKSKVSKELNKATDSWMPGDSVKVEKATCGAPGQKQVSGRKML